MDLSLDRCLGSRQATDRAKAPGTNKLHVMSVTIVGPYFF